MYKSNGYINKYYIENARKNSSEMSMLCKERIMIKYGLVGHMYCGIVINNIINNNDKILNFLNSINTPMYEVLHSNTKTKIYLDCEFDDVDFIKYEKRYEIFLLFDILFKNYLEKYKLNNKNILYSEASRKVYEGKYKISLHVIVNNCGYFRDRNILKNFVINFKNSLPEEFIINSKNFVDIKVYNVPQLFKIIYSPSKDNNQELIPFIIENNNIIKLDKKFISENFYDALVGEYKNDTLLDNNFLTNNKNIIVKNNKNDNKNNIIDIKQKKWIERNNYVKGIYKLRNDYLINNKIDLLRIQPAYCKLCNRTHENENAFCKITENNIIFYCGRNQTGVVIGSWYSKNTQKIEKLNFLKDSEILKKLKDENVNYVEEIEKLKNYNHELIKINNELREEIKKLKDKNKIKYNNQNNSYSTDVWNKYYTLALDFINNIDNNNIRGSWKDGNISRLKTRAFRVKDYIDKIREKGIINNLSLRKIFHMKNYEFSTLLSSMT
jgi:hypothetical protein